MNNKEKRKISIILNIVAIFIVVALTVLLVKSESKSSGISEFEMQASSYESGNRVGMQDIGISLLENGKIVAYRNYDSDSGGDTWSERGGVLLEDLLQGDNIKLGKDYDEIITVENTGTINEYVRATIYKYWTKREGEENVKDTELDPSLIEINVNEGDGWRIDEQGGTVERTVMYYDPVLEPGGTTPPLIESIRIKPEVGELVSSERTTDKKGYSVIEEKYKYDDRYFCIKIDVDAVQDHNSFAADAT